MQTNLRYHTNPHDIPDLLKNPQSIENHPINWGYYRHLNRRYQTNHLSGWVNK